jgi:hypothetical protein
MRDAGGVMLEKDYPYEAINRTCRFDRTKSVATVTGTNKYDFGLAGNESFVRQAVSAVGPMPAVLCVDPALYSYSSGVFSVNNCCTQIQHAGKSGISGI